MCQLFSQENIMGWCGILRWNRNPRIGDEDDYRINFLRWNRNPRIGDEDDYRINFLRWNRIPRIGQKYFFISYNNQTKIYVIIIKTNN